MVSSEFLTLIPLVGIPENYSRHKKHGLRPAVYGLLGAVPVKERSLKPTIKQLQRLHFLPRFDSRDKDPFQHGSIGFPNEPIPFYIQEVSFSEGGERPDTFEGPIVRFMLKNHSRFKLMIMSRAALFESDELALSLKGKLGFLFGSKLRPLTTESVQFNQNFLVLTNDQIRARSILTPRFLERIEGLKRIFGRSTPAHILFYDNQLIFAIKTSTDMFEFFKLSPKNPLQPYSRFYSEIKTLARLQNFFRFAKINSHCPLSLPQSSVPLPISGETAGFLTFCFLRVILNSAWRYSC